MEPMKKFLSSLYLGDRFCEKVTFENHKISFQMNCISRLKEGTKKWNYHCKQDVEHGCLVFDGVVGFSFSSGLFFNDEIYGIEVISNINGIYTFVVYGCNVSDDATSTDIQLHIKAKEFYFFDPKNDEMITK